MRIILLIKHAAADLVDAAVVTGGWIRLLHILHMPRLGEEAVAGIFRDACM